MLLILQLLQCIVNFSEITVTPIPHFSLTLKIYYNLVLILIFLPATTSTKSSINYLYANLNDLLNNYHPNRNTLQYFAPLYFETKNIRSSTDFSDLNMTLNYIWTHTSEKLHWQLGHVGLPC